MPRAVGRRLNWVIWDYQGERLGRGREGLSERRGPDSKSQGVTIGPGDVGEGVISWWQSLAGWGWEAPGGL